MNPPRDSAAPVAAASSASPANAPASSTATALADDHDFAEFAAELDALYAEVMAGRGADDERYIRRLITLQRRLDLGGRLTLTVATVTPFGPLAWIAGAGMLGVSKILDNMEIGHNVLHGQWDWLDDPEISSTTWEWDHACPAEQWKHLHNELHHEWTNVRGRDRDIGYGAVRIDEERPWRTADLANPVIYATLPFWFDYAISLHDIEELSLKRMGESDLGAAGPKLRQTARKIGRLLRKDYVAWPLLAAPFGLGAVGAAAAGGLAANTIRNVWTFVVIFNGHFPDGVEIFDEADVEHESRGRWYRRQVQGSANFTGGKLLHVMSGHLGFQIEHHCFPDMPSNHLRRIAPRAREICDRHGVRYHVASMPRQVASVARRVLRLSFPG